jgi:hypothetical protein
VVSASSGSIPGKKLDLYGAIEPVSVDDNGEGATLV